MDYFDEAFFSRRLNQLRSKRNISARDMSLSIGQSESYINLIENQRSLPSLNMVFVICEFLGVTPQEFFTVNEEPSVIIKEINENIARLESDQLQVLNNLVKIMASDPRIKDKILKAKRR